MPIRVDIHDNTSSIKVLPHTTSTVRSCASNYPDNSYLEKLLRNEIANRIAADEFLELQINTLSEHILKSIVIDEKENGSIEISLLNDKDEVITRDTINITEKIIKDVELDYDEAKIIYVCQDDSTIELNISDIVNKINDSLSRIETLETNLSILTGRVDNQELTLSSLINETIPGINNEISDIKGDISIINTTISDDIDPRLSILETNVATAELSIIDLQENKVDKVLSEYDNINPKLLTQEQIKNLLLYVSNSGIPNYAKLNELGFSRILNMADIDKAGDGDLLLDMSS